MSFFDEVCRLSAASIVRRRDSSLAQAFEYSVRPSDARSACHVVSQSGKRRVDEPDKPRPAMYDSEISSVAWSASAAILHSARPSVHRALPYVEDEGKVSPNLSWSMQDIVRRMVLGGSEQGCVP